MAIVDFMLSVTSRTKLPSFKAREPRMSDVSSSDSMQYLFFSPELPRLLHDNGMTAEEFLLRAGAAELKATSDPAAASGTREALTIFMGSAALVAAATPLIVKSLKAFLNRPVVHVERELIPVTDGHGDFRRGPGGSIIHQWRERPVLLAPAAQQSEKTQTTIKGLGIEIKVG